MIKLTSIVILNFIYLASFGQSASPRDSIYNYTEEMASYRNGEKELMRYVEKKIMPILAEYVKKDQTTITNLYISFTVTKEGAIEDISFPVPKLSIECKNKLSDELRKMGSWMPAKINTQPVCSRYILPIKCIRWEE